MEPASSKRIDRVNLACVQCRSRHVKCDATQPVCNRCSREGKECTYQKSRRGGLDKAALARRRLKLQQEAELAKEKQPDPNVAYQSPPQSSSGSSPMGDQALYGDLPSSCSGIGALSVADTHVPESNNMTFHISQDRLLEIFFCYFWPPFPVVLPLHFLRVRRTMQDHGMTELLLVLQYIGSLYAPWASSEAYYETAFTALCTDHIPRSPFNVQALMLFAIAQHHQHLLPESRVTMDLAIAMALELHMNEKGFAQAYGEGSPVLEECWRRTWYSLHINDQHLSVVSSTPVYLLSTIPTNVDLPCDDEFFETGNIPPPATWQEYENREFADIEVVYSSMVYMYDLSRVVLLVMNEFMITRTFTESLISRCDAKIAIWQSLLPAVKKDPLRKDGYVDEVMFMAHGMAAVILMTVHRSFSALKFSAEELTTRSFHSRALLVPSDPNGARGSHTARALKAAEMHTKLLAIPCAVEKHNLFLLNITAQLATASISACNNLLEDHALSIARDRIRLSIGFLNAMGTVWKLGKDMATEVRFVARSTLNGVQSTQQTVESGPTDEIELPRDELIWPIDPSAQINIYSGLEMGNWGDGSANTAYRNSADTTTRAVLDQDYRTH